MKIVTDLLPLGKCGEPLSDKIFPFRPFFTSSSALRGLFFPFSPFSFFLKVLYFMI